MKGFPAQLHNTAGTIFLLVRPSPSLLRGEEDLLNSPEDGEVGPGPGAQEGLYDFIAKRHRAR